MGRKGEAQEGKGAGEEGCPWKIRLWLLYMPGRAVAPPNPLFRELRLSQWNGLRNLSPILRFRVQRMEGLELVLALWFILKVHLLG